MRAIAAVAAALAVAGCMPWAEPAAAPVAPTGPVEPVRVEPASAGMVAFVFAPERVLLARLAEPVTTQALAPAKDAPPTPLAELFGAPAGDLAIYEVVEERWADAEGALCAPLPTEAIVLALSEGGAGRLAAVSGGAPGEPGATLCGLRDVAITQAGPG